jgi:outer membrane beta-barrel protein
MLFYHLNATWELLPGRQMVPYVGAGVGSALMLGRSTSSWNFGAGTRLFLSKKTAMRWDVRDFRFKDHTTSTVRTNNNVEFTLGTEIIL